jgi:hypothetical protein
MTHRKAVLGMVVVAFFTWAFNAQIAHSQESAASAGVQVHMVITDQAVRDDTEIPVLQPKNVQVKQGKNVLKVNQVIPARGDNAALQFFILIDETCDNNIGNNLNDIRDFVNALPLPPTTAVGIGYMSNASVQIIQNFTADHALAAKAIRLPRGTLSSMDSPYLSLVSLVKGWPEGKVRREVLMVTGGIDRLRGQAPSSLSSASLQAPGSSARTPAGSPTRSLASPPITRSIGGSPGMPTISVDADSASRTSQRYGVIVHSIYSPGVGRVGRNAWEAQWGHRASPRSLMKPVENSSRWEP